ncbi:MAG: hypothetical protein Q9M39_09985 [Sulfurovum sp.]|nr:hypothetical protein [Sulfurovum sp.]
MKVTKKQYRGLLLHVRDYFEASEHTIHKARNEIKIISSNDNSMVIKSFKIPHFINKIVYTFFRESKAKKSYENSMRIADFVPCPIGYIEFYKFGLIKDSYFVSENFTYDFTIREPLVKENFLDKKNIFKAFALFTYTLHEKNIFHLDYSPGNILIKKLKEGYLFKIVDINRMKFKKLTLDEKLKNFSKLWAKDEDLETIMREYAGLINTDEKKMC